MEGEYVEGLTGEEIIVDVLEQVAAKLRGDCNLREADSYTGGYDGWVEVHLNLRGLDTALVKTKIVMGTAGEDPDQITVVAKIPIELEPALNVVRERSGQEIPSLGKDETGKIVVKKRRYGKPQFGGATGEALEQV